MPRELELEKSKVVCTKKNKNDLDVSGGSLQSCKFLQSGGRAAAKATKVSRLNDQNITSFWGRGVNVLLIETDCALFAALLDKFATLK